MDTTAFDKTIEKFNKTYKKSQRSKRRQKRKMIYLSTYLKNNT